jgi:acyl carrier protein
MQDLYAGLADIFEVEVDEIGPDTLLAEHGWDSLAIVSTIALFDEIFGKEVNVEALNNCETVADLEKLANN